MILATTEFNLNHISTGDIFRANIAGGTELGLNDYPTFNSPYEAGDAMIDAGFNLVSLATNHTMDSGKKAVENSCKYWNSKENVLTAGSYCSEEERKSECDYQDPDTTTAKIVLT
mgnify:CR=1 FL=1